MRRTFALQLLAIVTGSLAACDPDDDHDDRVSEVMMASGEAEHAFDNAGACEALADRVPCGQARLAAELGCASMNAYACDLGAYLDCIEDQVVCTAGELDTFDVPICLELLSCD